MTIIQKSQKALEYDKILQELAKFAKTEQSRIKCLELVPFDDFEIINEQIKYTAEAKTLLDFPSSTATWKVYVPAGRFT